MSKIRAKRKKEHLILALQGSRCSFANYYSDIMLLHDCLTEINANQVDLTSNLCGYPTKTPLYINAVTGGALVAEAINRNFATLARKHGLAMAVGSQTAAIKQKQLRFTYQVVRKHNPDGIIMANLSASATLPEAKEAVSMLDAQILQLHVNPAQELIMPEGDKLKPRLIDNIAMICQGLSVPVVVKEVGFGMTAVQAKELQQAGVSAVDISGKGGTNFARIEGRRNQSNWWMPLESWGLPTLLCVADVAAKVQNLQVLASGGVDDGVRAIKCMVLGARSVGIAGSLLKVLYHSGLAEADKFINAYLKQMRVAITLMGKNGIDELDIGSALITGRLAELLKRQGII